jgi:hypothetical protein
MTLLRILLIATAALIAHDVAAQPSGPDGNIPLPAPVLEQRLLNDPFQVVAVGKTSGGIMTTEKVTLLFPSDGMRIKAKWKAAPSGGGGWNNHPSREIGAYQVQELFLDPEDYVVPPSVARCIPLADYAPIQADAKPTLPHTRCVLGTLSAWLDNVEEPKETYDVERFKRDPRFARLFANLNILTYLIAHRDRRPSNFLISTDELNPQMFSVDNGIAFGDMLFNYLNWQFDHIVIGSVPAAAVARLRAVTPARLQAFAVLEDLQPDADGILRPVSGAAVVDPTRGERLDGKGVQIGLTTAEIRDLAQRVRDLLANVDSGALKVF